MADTTIKKRLAAGVAAGTIAAASLGLSAYALWSETADTSDSTIQAGNLQIAASGTMARDISPDRADSPHTINLATWRAVPGDVVEVAHSLDIALSGDNLVAQLDIAALNAALDTRITAAGATDVNGDGARTVRDYVTVTTELQQGTGPTAAVPAEAGTHRYLFQATPNGQLPGANDGTLAIVGTTLDNAVDARAVVTVAFAASTPAQVLTNSQLYSAISTPVLLDQVRTGAGTAFTP